MGRPGSAGALATPILVLIVLAPLAAGLLGTLLPAFGWLPVLGADQPSLQPWRDLLGAPGLLRALVLSLWTGLGATFLAVAAAILIVAAGHDRRWFVRLRGLLAPLLAVPHAAAAAGLLFLIAPSGLILRLLSPWATGAELPPDIALVQDAYGLALLAGLALRELPFVLFVLLAAVGQVRAERQLDAARPLGRQPVAAWLEIVLPQAYPKIRLPILAVLVFSMSVVDMAVILGPNAPPPFAVLLTRWFLDPDLGLRLQASAGAVLLLAVTIASCILWRMLERRWLAAGCPLGIGHERLARGLGSGLALLLLAVSLGSLSALMLWAVGTTWRFPDALPTGIGTATLIRAYGLLDRAAANTLLIGGGATALALMLTILVLVRRDTATTAIARLAWLPLLVPQIGFLFGTQIAMLRLGIDGRLSGLVWAHLLFVLPYTLLILREPWLRLAPRYAEAARALGAGPWRTLIRITLPLLRGPIAVAAAVGFAVSCAQFLPTLFVGGGRWPTLATETLALMQGGDRRVAAAAALALMLLPFVATLLALRLLGQDIVERQRLLGVASQPRQRSILVPVR